MPHELPDNAGVVAPPPLIYLSAVLLGALLNYLHPLNTGVSRVFAVIIGIVCTVLAVALCFSALRLFTVAKTRAEPWKPTSAIVSTGVYGISRNPMYLAFTLLYLGIAAFVNTWWLLLLLVPVLLVMHYGVIKREEQYLERKFGAEYTEYKARVRRWL